MPALRRTRAAEPPQEPRPNLPAVRAADSVTLQASAAPLDLDPNKVFRMRTYDQEWQNEGWRHYDICGELRFVANRQAAALSRLRLYVADVDEQGKITGETKNAKMAALGSTVFGSEATRAEAIRLWAINQYIAGECYIVAIGAANPKSDKWFIVSRKEIRKQGGSVQVKQPLEYGGDWATLKAGQDLLIRSWTPHARLKDVADSPVRPVLPTLREIERLTMLTFSQIDSRLISAGLLLIEQGVDFPHAADKPGGAQALIDQISEAANAQLNGAGTAAGIVPIIAEVPMSGIEGRSNVSQAFAHIKFDSPLQAEIRDKIDQAIRRLALGLDVAPEDLLGQGDANHWSGWQIEETTIKVFIEPPAIRLCDALNVGYLRAAAKLNGEDPDKFSFWYDTSDLVVRPNRQQDALALFEQEIVTAETVRDAGGWDDQAEPSADELLVRRAWTLVQAMPALIGDPTIAKILGFPTGIQVGPSAPPPPAPVDANGQPIEPPPPDNQQDSGTDQRALPTMPDQQQSPAQGGQPAVTASVYVGDGLLDKAMIGGELVVLRALELAGSRLLDRNSRGRYGHLPRHELHTAIRPRDVEHAETLVAGAFNHVPALAQQLGLPSAPLEELLGKYVLELLDRGYAHSTTLLRDVLKTGLRL